MFRKLMIRLMESVRELLLLSNLSFKRILRNLNRKCSCLLPTLSVARTGSTDKLVSEHLPLLFLVFLSRNHKNW